MKMLVMLLFLAVNIPLMAMEDLLRPNNMQRNSSFPRMERMHPNNIVERVNRNMLEGKSTTLDSEEMRLYQQEARKESSFEKTCRILALAFGTAAVVCIALPTILNK